MFTVSAASFEIVVSPDLYMTPSCDRDCTRFDVQARADELFDALDEDGSGGIDEEEFIAGCMMDELFVKLLEEFTGDDIWGIEMKEK